MEDFYEEQHHNQSRKSDAMTTIFTGISQFPRLQSRASLPNQNLYFCTFLSQ